MANPVRLVVRSSLMALAVATSLGVAHAQTATPKGAAAGGAKKVVPVVLFTTWRDPSEGSFTVSVPQGWQVSGGAARHSPLDVQQWVHVAMPTGRVQIFIGDPDIVPRTVPNQMTMMAGLREGQVQRPQWGGTVLVERFRSGQDYAREFIARKLCAQPEITSSRDLPEPANAMTAQIAPYGRSAGAAVRASIGEVYYRCGPRVGYVTSTTVLAGPLAGQGAQTWSVLQVSGFALTNGPDAGYAQYVLHTMASSFKVDPRWQARTDQQTRAVTASVTQMQQTMMANMQQQNAALANTERARITASNNSFDVMKPWQKRMDALDANRVKDSDTRLGTTVTSDPLWGDRTVSNDSYYYWTRPDGSIAGTNTASPPDLSSGWRQMTTHP